MTSPDDVAGHGIIPVVNDVVHPVQETVWSQPMMVQGVFVPELEHGEDSPGMARGRGFRRNRGGHAGHLPEAYKFGAQAEGKGDQDQKTVKSVCLGWPS